MVELSDIGYYREMKEEITVNWGKINDFSHPGSPLQPSFGG